MPWKRGVLFCRERTNDDVDLVPRMASRLAQVIRRSLANDNTDRFIVLSSTISTQRRRDGRPGCRSTSKPALNGWRRMSRHGRDGVYEVIEGGRAP
jgi:hypothetical protein